MLNRKVKSILDKFALDKGGKALLITGARQVGKTFSIREFAKRHYDSYLEINFIRDREALKIFKDVADEKDVLRRLTAYAGGRIKPGKSLVFLDEIQKCPEAVTYLKFLVEDGSYRFICSGSLLGVELKNVRSVPVGFLDEIEMHPLDFEEFLEAVGFDREALASVGAAIERREAVDGFLHDRLMRLWRLYLVVGGMPAAVQEYVDSNDLARVADVQRAIIATYHRDISQYDERNALKIRDVYDRLPSELASENKRFAIGSVVPGSHFKRIEDGFLWLKNAGVALASYCVAEPKAPLRLSEKRNMFKLFANDVGLLAAMYMEGIQLRILNGDRALNIGAVYENAVAQELTAHGLRPDYFNSKKQGELDFVLERGGCIVPVEVKSGKDYKRHSALDKVLADGNYGIGQAYVLGNDNLSVDGSVVYAPVYATMFIRAPALPEKFVYPTP